MDRHRAAEAAISEAARRAELLMSTLATNDGAGGGKGPREKAAAQRRWLSVLDRHEAWIRRRCVRMCCCFVSFFRGGGALLVLVCTRLTNVKTSVSVRLKVEQHALCVCSFFFFVASTALTG